MTLTDEAQLHESQNRTAWGEPEVSENATHIFTCLGSAPAPRVNSLRAGSEETQLIDLPEEDSGSSESSDRRLIPVDQRSVEVSRRV